MSICKLEKHLHTLPPYAAPHWLIVWKSTIPMAAWNSSPLRARFQTQPISSLFPPPHGPFGLSRHLCPSWTVRPPIGWLCSAPPATGCAPCPAPRWLLSDWLTRERMRWERGTAQRSRIVVEPGGQTLEDPAERRHDATESDAKEAQSGSGSFPCHCCRRVIYTRLNVDKIKSSFVLTT